MTKPNIKFRDLLKGTEFEKGINNLISDSKNKVFGDLRKNGFEHSSKVEYYIDQLVPDEVKERLNEFEIYVLLCAVYLHDIGYVKDSKLVSKGHEKRSHDRILNQYPEFKEYGLDNVHKARAVAEVCFGHASEQEHPLRKIPGDYSIDEWEGELNLRFLSAILLLADEVHNAYTRVIGRKEEKKSMRSRVGSVNIDTERWRIKFIINPLSSEEWKLLDGMRKYTQNRLDEIIGVIEPEGLLYDLIETDKSENPFKEQEKQKSDIETLKKISAILKLKGYENVEYNAVCSEGNVADLYGEFNMPDGTSQRTIFGCYKKVDVDAVEDFNALMGRVKSDIDTGFIISEQDIPGDNINESIKNKNIRLWTLNDLLKSFNDIENYINWVIEDYEESEVSNYYVELGCEKPDADRPMSYDSLDKYIDDVWLITKNKNYISILGEYGTGKTTFCRKYACELAKRYKTNRTKTRIPIILNLSRYTKSIDIEQVITDFLINEHELKNMDFKTFNLLNEAGMFLLIFDGFDEMSQRVDYKVIENNFNELLKTVTQNSKVLLTCRTEFFRSSEQVKKIISVDIKERPNFEVIYLKEFTEDMIEKFLKYRAGESWKDYLEKIRKTYNLMNLAHRPVLLDMIVQSLPDLIKSGKEINAADLYKVYTDYWMERDIKTHRTLLDNKEKKSLFMQELAFKMFSTGVLGIHYKDIPGPVKQHFNLEEQLDVDHFSHDIMTCSFLIRDSEGNYKFAHKSFMEFFAAEKFAGEIKNELKENFGRTPITIEIANFLVDLIRDRNYSNILFDFIDYTKDKTLKENEKYIGGNAVTLLNLLGESFSGKDFSNTCLMNADFSNTDLAGTNFSYAVLKNANLKNAILKNVDFSYANLEGAAFGGMDMVKSVFVTPDKKHIVSGSGDNTIKIWDFERGEEIRTLEGHNNSVVSVFVTPDRKNIVSGSGDKTIKIWDFEKGEEIRTLKEHKSIVESVFVTPDKKFIVSGSWDKTIKIWDFEKGEEIRTLEGHNEFVWSVFVTPDKKHIVSGSGDNTIKIWDFEKGEEISNS
ncbi:MAG: hypothetical protein A7315_00250 [Candidatus Altiarchaeales archaeon WOR_SM1_79]|nr:MAG: hypothetical protein A7315_00250 [Candidatus Altiarchaeales archaeon WOR_SM1_79]